MTTDDCVETPQCQSAANTYVLPGDEIMYNCMPPSKARWRNQECRTVSTVGTRTLPKRPSGGGRNGGTDDRHDFHRSGARAPPSEDRMCGGGGVCVGEQGRWGGAG